jgi:hypothetical protein
MQALLFDSSFFLGYFLGVWANISMQKTLKWLTLSFFPHQGSNGVFSMRVLLLQLL